MQHAAFKPWMQWYDDKMKNLDFTKSIVIFLSRKYGSRFPNHNAIIFEDRKTDYKTLKSQVDKLAVAWKDMGFTKGELIGLMMANHPLFIVSYYAAYALGLTVVQINQLYTLREFLEIVKDTKIHYIVFKIQFTECS